MYRIPLKGGTSLKLPVGGRDENSDCFHVCFRNDVLPPQPWKCRDCLKNRDLKSEKLLRISCDKSDKKHRILEFKDKRYAWGYRNKRNICYPHKEIPANIPLVMNNWSVWTRKTAKQWAPSDSLYCGSGDKKCTWARNICHRLRKSQKIHCLICQELFYSSYAH